MRRDPKAIWLAIAMTVLVAAVIYIALPAIVYVALWVLHNLGIDPEINPPL